MSTTSARPFDAVLCDLDGVVRHWPPADAMEATHGLPAGALAAAAFAPARLGPAVTGQVSDEQWRAAVTEDLAARHGSRPRAEAVVADWSAVLPAIDEDVVALLRRIREVASVALVTNATTRLERDLERQGLDGLADVVVNSSRIGVAKPDPRVVRVAAERLGVPVGRCLFVDDTEANVLAAREIGMTALHHRRVADLRTALQPLLGGAA